MKNIPNLLNILFRKTDKKTLLWTNPSPTSIFNAQTINLPVDDYDALDIVFRWDTNYAFVDTYRMYKDANIAPCLFDYNTAAKYSRAAKWSTNGVDFIGGFKTNSANNAACIPVRIYGIKLAGGGVRLNLNIIKAFSHLQRLEVAA